CLGGEDRARDLDDGAEQRAETLLRAERRGGDGCVQIGHRLPPTLDEMRCSTLFSWNGVSSGCVERTSAQMPEMWGVAKLLPDALSVWPFTQATSTLTPRAKNSTGGVGGGEKGRRLSLPSLPAGAHRRN